MKFERVDSGDELGVLRAMAVDKVVLSRLSPLFADHGTPFRNRWATMVANWCCRYFEKYGDSPPPAFLQKQAEKWATKHDDEPVAKMLDRFLDELFNWDPELLSNSEYEIDKAGELFNKVRIEVLAEELTDDVERGDVDVATDRLLQWNRVDLGAGHSIDVLRDMDAMREAFDDDEEALVEYSGGLKRFFANSLQRDGFISFLGPEKRGKSFWLMDVAWRAMKQRRRVAFFEVGDMSQAQIMRRFAVRSTRRPIAARTLDIPTDINWKEGGKPGEYVVTRKKRSWDKRMGWQEAYKANEKVLSMLSTTQPMLRLAVHPNSSVGVDDIERTLDVWERTGWTADVVVIDYADNLLWPSGATDERSASNLTWKHLRRLSQQRHCLVVTATQASADSYSAYTLSKRHFSEDKRKLAHVTGMIGINMTEQEKKDGVVRLNWIASRDLPFTEFECALCAGQRPLGNLAMKSVF